MWPITRESLADSVPGTESGCFRVPLYIENIQISFPLTMGIPVVPENTPTLEWLQDYLIDNFIDITDLACPVKNLKFSIVSCMYNVCAKNLWFNPEAAAHYSKYKICTDTSVLIAISFTEFTNHAMPVSKTSWKTTTGRQRSKTMRIDLEKRRS